MPLLHAGDGLPEKTVALVKKVLATEDPTENFNATSDVKDKVRAMVRTASSEEAELAKEHLEHLVQEPKKARQPSSGAPWGDGGKISKSSSSPVLQQSKPVQQHQNQTQ